MSAKTVKLISPERVKSIFDCYGANPDCWPNDEKVAALSLIQNSSELQELQREAASFDKLLKNSDLEIVTDQAATSELLEKIVGSLPEQDKKPNSRFTNNESSHKRSFFDLNRSLAAIAASIAVVAISLSIATMTPESVKPVSSVAMSQTELDDWMWEQVVGESTDESEEPLSMLALLELEEL